MANEFAETLNALTNARQGQTNRQVASDNFSFRTQAADLANRQFDAQQQQQQRENLMDTAFKSLEFSSKVGPLLPPEHQKELFQDVSEHMRQAGVIPQGTAFDFDSADEALNDMKRMEVQGDVAGSQNRFQQFMAHGFKPEAEANAARLQTETAIVGMGGSLKNIINQRSKNQAISQSEHDRLGVRDPDRARLFEEAKQVYGDDIIQAADARAEELNGWRKIPPAILDEIITLKRVADIGGNLSKPDQQKVVATNKFDSLNTVRANLEAGGHPVPKVLIEAINIQRKIMGVGAEIPVEDEASAARLSKLKTDEINVRSQIASRTVENGRIMAQTNVLNATIPKIQQTIESMKATQGNTEAKTALFENQLLTDQRKMKAIAPRLTQARDELMQRGQELFSELEDISHSRDIDITQLNKMADEIKSNGLAVNDLNRQIEFAEAVGPEIFLTYERLGAQMEDMELRRQKNVTEVTDLNRKRAELVSAQTEGKLSENARKAQGDERAVLVARASRELNLDSPSLQRDAQAWLKANDPGNLVSIQDIVKGSGIKRPLKVELSTGPTTAMRTKSQETQDKAGFALTYLDKLESVANSSTVGGVGKLRAFVHGLGQQASAVTHEFKGDRNKAIATIAEKGGDIDESIFFDKDLTQYQMQARLSAFFMADAIADQSGRALSDQDRKAFEHALGFSDTITGVEQVKDNIQTARELLDEKLKIAGKRLGEAQSQSTDLPDLSEKTDEDLLDIIKGAFQ